MKPITGRLVPDWNHAHRWWSVRLMVLEALLQAVPAEKFLMIYSYLPEDVQALLPGRTPILVAVALLAGVARIVDQRKGRGHADY